VLQFKGGLQEQAGEVLEPLSRILAALHQLRASPALRALLHTALRLGNALNAGRKAPARGIRLAHLRKLADTRSMDGATTLLHYLAALAREACPAVRADRRAVCAAAGRWMQGCRHGLSVGADSTLQGWCLVGGYSLKAEGCWPGEGSGRRAAAGCGVSEGPLARRR
jgi:hypothetical protein